MNWRWRVRAYYAHDVRPPKVPGKLALELVFVTAGQRDMDLDILKKRRDIGRVEVFDLEHPKMEIVK